MQVFVNDQPRQVQPCTSVAELLESLGLSPRQVAVEVNLRLVPRSVHAQCQLAEGDRLEVVTLVGGG